MDAGALLRRLSDRRVQGIAIVVTAALILGVAALGLVATRKKGNRDQGTAGPAAPRGPVGPAVTGGTIKIGLAYDKNAGALNQAYGFAGVGQIDGKRAWETLVDTVNKSGGVNGRQLEIVWHVLDQLDGKNQDTVAQEMCATYTQDNKVYAAFVTGIDALR